MMANMKKTINVLGSVFLSVILLGIPMLFTYCLCLGTSDSLSIAVLVGTVFIMEFAALCGCFYQMADDEIEEEKVE